MNPDLDTIVVFLQRLNMLSDQDYEGLVKYVNRSLDEEEDFHFLRFEFLQRLNLAQLQVRLVRLKSKIQREGKTSKRVLKELENTLAVYGTCLIESN